MIKSFNSGALLLAAILGCSSKAAAQTTTYVTLIAYSGSTNYPVQTNQVVSLVGYDWVSKPSVFADGCSLSPTAVTTTTASQLSLPYLTDTFAISSPPTFAIPQIVTGGTNILVAGGWATFKITTPACINLANNYTPADAVVIPTSATGNVQIILESSADLVNWTAANPGIYGASSATNRFFRVRAVLQ
jgi:hypothetical protein